MSEAVSRNDAETRTGFEEYAKALETCFRSLAAASAHRPPAGAVVGAVWRLLPASLQAAIGSDAPEATMLDGHRSAEAIEAGNALPSAPPAAVEFHVQNHPGDEAGSSACILGRVEQFFGADADVLLARWAAATGAAVDAKSTMAFCDAVARRSVGFVQDPLPGVGVLRLAQWTMPETTGSVLKEFAAAAGTAMFTRAQAARLAALGWPAGDVAVVLPPDVAVIEGARLAGRVEEANGRSIGDMVSHVRCMEGYRKVDGAAFDTATVTVAQFAQAVAAIATGTAGYRPGAGDLDIVVPAMAYLHVDGLAPLPPKADQEKEAAIG